MQVFRTKVFWEETWRINVPKMKMLAVNVHIYKFKMFQSILMLMTKCLVFRITISIVPSFGFKDLVDKRKHQELSV